MSTYRSLLGNWTINTDGSFFLKNSGGSTLISGDAVGSLFVKAGLFLPVETIISSDNFIFGQLSKQVIITTNSSGSTLVGNVGNDLLIGDSGNDTLIGGEGADILDGRGGADTASYEMSLAGVVVNLATGSASGGDATGDKLVSIERVIGSNFNDVLTGSKGNNVLSGMEGNDILKGGLGADTLDGGSGIDTAVYSDSSVGVNVNLTTGRGLGGTAQGDRLLNVENLVGSAFNDTLTGNGADNILNGGGGNDRLVGGGGNDLLIGGLGKDALIGGSGVDTVSYSAASSGVVANLTNSANNHGEAAGDTYSGIENIIGSRFNDTLVGNSGDNVLNGGRGNDTLNGGSGNDTASYENAAGGVTVNLVTGLSSGADGVDKLISIENIIGSEHDDTFTGNAVGNVISGGGGNDTFIAVSPEFIDGDSIDGGTGSDAIDFSQFLVGVVIDLENNTLSIPTFPAVNFTFSNIENLIGTQENDILVGNSDDNVLIGLGGNDNLFGLGGNDFLVPGDGSAIVNGGDGNDTLLAGNGTQTYDGGSGYDVLDYSGLSSFGNAVLDATNQTLNEGVAVGDLYSNIEEFFLTANGDQFITSAAAETIRGLGGDDTFIVTTNTPYESSPFIGSDTYDGGGGIDTVNYGGLGSGITFFQSNLDSLGNTLISIENISGTGFDDKIIGASGVDNVISGGGGNDILIGDEFDDNNNSLLTAQVIDRLDFGALSGDVPFPDDFGNEHLPSVNVEGSISQPGDKDFYQVHLLAGERLILDIDRTTGGSNTLLTVFDSNGTVIARNDDSPTTMGGEGSNLTSDSYLQFTANTEGTYYVAVTMSPQYLGNAGDTLNTSSTTGDYHLNMSIDNVEGTIGFTAATVNEVTTLPGNDTLNGDSGNDTLYGLSGNDTLNGGTGDDKLYGGNGDDILNGGDGNDQHFGGTGDDIMQGNPGADAYTFGDGMDTLDYSGSPSSVLIDLTAGTGTGPIDSFSTGDTYLDTPEIVVGSAFDDGITGNALANTFFGGDGGDLLTGLAGNDYLNGDAGNDILIGDDLLNVATTGNDLLLGGEGDDRLIGGPGSDILSGGSGQDTFVYNNAGDAGDGSEHIMDFSLDENDKIDVSSLLTSFGLADHSTAFSAGYLQTISSGNDTILQFDADGGGDNFTTLVTLDNLVTTDTNDPTLLSHIILG